MTLTDWDIVCFFCLMFLGLMISAMPARGG